MKSSRSRDDEVLLIENRGDEEGGGTEEGDAGGEAVHVIEKVEGVGEGDNPEDREDRREEEAG